MTGISEQEMEEAWRFDQAMHEVQRGAFCDYEEANRRLAELMRSLIYYVSKGIRNEERIREGVFKSETPEERKKGGGRQSVIRDDPELSGQKFGAGYSAQSLGYH